MRLLRRVAGRADEGLQPDHEGNGEHQRVAGDRNQSQKHRPGFADGKPCIDFLLGKKAEEQRQPAHRQRGQQTGGERHRHGAAKSAEPRDVARAGLVVDQPRHHEQRALEHGMRDEIEHRRLDRPLRAEAGQHHQQPERADGRVGEHQLEVGLPDRQQRPDDAASRRRTAAAASPTPPCRRAPG